MYNEFENNIIIISGENELIYLQAWPHNDTIVEYVSFRSFVLTP